MADKTSLIIESTDQSGKKLSRSVTDIKPDATNEQLRTFAQRFNALSTNTFEDAIRVQRRSVGTEKPAPTFQLYDGPPASGQVLNSVPWSTVAAGMANGIFSLNSSAIPYVKKNTTFAGAALYNLINPENPEYNGWSVNLTPIGDDATLDQLVGKVFCDNGVTPLGKAGTIVFAVDETDDYAAAEFTLTVTN